MKSVVFIIFMASPAMASFSGYTYQRQLTINHTKVSTGTLTYTNFPVLFQATDVTLSTSVSGGHLSSANGYDLIFSTNSDCSFALNWDTETVNTTGSQQDNIWVNIPSISSTTDTILYLCYGNAAITSYLGLSTATWDNNYIGVLHLSRTVSGNILLNDSTSPTNNFFGSIVGSTSSLNGKIGAAASFVATSSNTIVIGDNASAMGQVVTVPGTISLWYYLNSAPTNNSNGAFSIFSDASGAHFSRQIGLQPTDLVVNLTQTDCTTNQFFIYSGTNPLILNTWHYVTFSTSGTLSSPSVYVSIDGNSQSFAPALASCSATGSFPDIGLNMGQQPFDGFMDEFRMSNIARSPDWTLTEYNSQNSPTTFMTMGPELGGAIPGNDGILIQGKTTMSARVTVQ